MHVCHFCETSVEGQYFKNITKGLIRNGVRVSLLELGVYKPPTWLGEVPEAKYYNLGVTCKAQYPKAIFQLAALLKREKIDILQTHLYYAGLIGVLAKRLSRRTTVVLTRHHTSVVRMLGKRYHLYLDKWMAENANYVVAVSEATRNYMIQMDGICRDNIETIHLGFDFDKLQPSGAARKRIRAEFGYEENDFVIGYAGNLVPGKGHLQLVEAFSKIAKVIPNAKLFFAGDWRLEEVDKAIEKLSLQNKIAFAGWRNDVIDCYNALDLFVQPSLSEAFSQVLIEAMSLSLPVIATNVGGAFEVITNGENGFLVEPNDIEAICQRTLELYNSKALRDKFASAGSETVRQRFGVERMVERQLHLYNEWLKDKK